MELELILKENNTQTARMTLGSGEFVVGRDATCEVRIPSDAVSRRHARLTIGDDGVFIQDLGSANGTYLDGQRVEGRAPLAPGQKVEMGLVVMQAHWNAPVLGKQATVIEDIAPEETELTEQLLHDKKYEMGAVVAMGGMGVVRRAKDLRVRRLVAMKLMSPSAVDTLPKRLRFLEEAQVTGQLEHPNIVPVYDLGIDEHDQPYYTMKFVRGVNLKDILEDIRTGKQDTIKQFPLGRLLTIFQKACDAIAFAHSKGIIHRDLKPDNIMIGDFGEVLLMDWGLAKRTGPTEERKELDDTQAINLPAFRTAAGAVMGTPNFMSPEQATGKIDELDARTDIFMLGGVLYCILTLRPPFPGETSQEALQRIHAGIITPPLDFNTEKLAHHPDGRIPESLAAVAMKALAYRPDDRYQTIRELQKDLEKFQGGFATSAEQAGTFKQLVLLIKRRQAEFTLLAVTVVALLAVAGVAVGRIVASEHRAQESLRALRAAAPAYASQAESLIDDHRFDEALGKISTALELMPERVDFYVLKGNILESLLRLPEARTAYEEAIALEPHSESAHQNLALCNKLIEESAGCDELPVASLNELQAAMLKQNRSAEALAMVRRLDKNNETVLATWRRVLDSAGLLDKSKGPSQLIVDGAGQFTLNLNRENIDNIAVLKDMPLKELQLMLTEVRDLTPLRGAPLQFLNLAATPVADLEPLRGLPLKTLVLAGCRNLTDLTPLCDCRELEMIILPPHPEDIECLRSLPKLTRIASPQRFGSAVRDEIGGRLARIAAPARGLKPIFDETQTAAEFWKEYDARPNTAK